MVSDYYRYLWRLGPIAFSRGMPYGRCVEYPEVVRRLELRPEDHLLDVGSRGPRTGLREEATRDHPSRPPGKIPARWGEVGVSGCRCR